MNFSKKPIVEREITVTRVLAAPRALVFSMFTDAKHLAAWWGPHTWDNPVSEADPRPGGKILIHMRGPDGIAHPMGGVYHEIVPHERIAFTTFVDMPDGNRIIELHNTVRFEESGGKTKVILHARAGGFADFAANMLAGMEAGWSQSLDKLAAHAARQNGNADADDQAAIRAMFGDRTNALFGKVADLALKHVAPRHRVLRSRRAAAARRPRQGRAAKVVRHLGRADRLGDGRSHRGGRRRRGVRATGSAT